MAVFDVLDYWLDDRPRTGEENMAVDQLMMERVGQRPMLRVYRWSKPTVSFGYFLKLDDARRAFPACPESPLCYVRRWTGGGIVDHRIDLTYTLAIPRCHPLAGERGAESYRVIHQALADVLGELGCAVRLTAVNEGDGGLACFTNPVAYDLTNPGGDKTAGAGQRRSRYGLLHQGSLVADVAAADLGDSLARRLAAEVCPWSPDEDFLANAGELAMERYATTKWLEKNDTVG